VLVRVATFAGIDLPFLINARFEECGLGNVNASAGPPEDVLKINGDAGASCDRGVVVQQGAPITVSFAASSAGPSTNARSGPSRGRS